MFSNPIKRLSESLAQAQEQARQQRQKSFARPPDSRPLFDADNEEASFVNGEDATPTQPSEESAAKSPEEAAKLASVLDTKDPTLPKEVRIKLAKLAKYEDRHPKLQAAYKESQGRIATFEKVLRERTPLGSIDQVDDFDNYLNTLSMRTNMSLEELKRVTEAHDNLKTQMVAVQEKHKQESESQENNIQELRKKMEQLESEAAQRMIHTQKLDDLCDELKEKKLALEDAENIQTTLQKDIEQLRQKLEEAEIRRADTASAEESLEQILNQKDSLALSLKLLQNTLDDTVKAKDLAEVALYNEKLATERRISQLEGEKHKLEIELASAIQETSRTAPLLTEVDKLEDEVASSTIMQQDITAAGNKKKKKKKKKGTAAIAPVSPQQETQEKSQDSYNRRLLEEYLVQLTKSLSDDNLEEIAGSLAQLEDGTVLWNELIARGIQPFKLEYLRASVESLSIDVALDFKVQDLDAKISLFASKVSSLGKQLRDSNAAQAVLKGQLELAEKELQAARDYGKDLFVKNQHLESASEDIEQLRDMLRDVGSDLVEAKDKIKEVERREATAQTMKLELETLISKLKNELQESRESAQSLEKLQSQVTLAESHADYRLTELNEAKEKLNSAESELVSLKAELGTVSADKNDLTAKLAETQTKIRQLERSEKETRDRATAFQSSLTLKEKEVVNFRAELSQIQAFKSQLEESLRSTRLEYSKLESERKEIQQREQTSREDSTRFKIEADLYRDKVTSLELLRTSLTRDSDALSNEVQMKTVQLESSQTLVQSLREQTAEMGHRARESKERCDALEEELSEAHKLLSERAREAATIRRLLDEAEGREAGRIKEAREKLDFAMEECDRLEEEIMLLRRNNAEGSGELTRTLREKEATLKNLNTKYEELKKEVDTLLERNNELETRLQQARQEADDATSKLNKMSMSLEETTLQTRQLQEERDSLKEAAEESQIRVDQLQRTQRHLSEELKRLKAAEKRTQQLPTLHDSRVSPTDSRSHAPQTSQQPVSSNGSDPSRAAIDKEYLRNVLLQFFEHKDKRAQLLPVLSMLLNFSKADEMKLLR